MSLELLCIMTGATVAQMVSNWTISERWYDDFDKQCRGPRQNMLSWGSVLMTKITNLLSLKNEIHGNYSDLVLLILSREPDKGDSGYANPEIIFP